MNTKSDFPDWDDKERRHQEMIMATLMSGLLASGSFTHSEHPPGVLMNASEENALVTMEAWILLSEIQEFVKERT